MGHKLLATLFDTPPKLSIYCPTVLGTPPFIVFDDADIDSVVNAKVSVIFASTGQICVAGSRLISSRKIKNELLSKLVAKAKAVIIGDPQNMATEVRRPCIIKQLNHGLAGIDASIKEGAKLLVGGIAIESDGFYFPHHSRLQLCTKCHLC